MRPDRIKFESDSMAIIGLFHDKVLRYSDISKVTLNFAESNDPFGLKRKISIDSVSGQAANVSVFPLEFNIEKFVLALENHGVDVSVDS